MDNKNETEIFEIIAHGGNAKSLAYEALNSATEGNFEEAEKFLDESEREMAEAHKTQTRLIQDEINGEKVDTSLLMIHAQDHLMTALSEKSLIEKMIELYKKLEEK
ncbi:MULTISPECIES: PTS lactose/cellobiose transporter subunit IIA [unclassified Staphylococcus]|uniref:PTS lactose/cellobiose transporter subunit IIA n=1 Tax=unclassified Staphylococcus TaxID=91994 RepID=UPI001881D15D|nr:MULTISPECIES: PTS lactose/cellobiose transporter subunit IIA [unclassified Staphylococcus]MBF2756447.1 PTS lactose/cellobiose transporter subunit IIA [Staphylococcus haemolyticus]MBF2773694.1 PTS lactose/cellobiose transporter subunit IIA [Staphylococcus haemolyticus]MBF2775811.1 PTS lactose/cellobiose transporter subunit IIA [Staphylococcus haemolyticus]MBF2815380.1 PTS lactose/cellobiose transporter subunit IIA [Staphylococcus haemolyticus]MBF9719847.1 PTS lactose/cellobiose transporter s